MKGCIVKRSKTSWALVIERDRDSSGKRKQQWIKFTPDPTKDAKENDDAAEAKLTEIKYGLNKGTYVDPTKTTLLEYLRAWVEDTVKPTRRASTHRTYATFIEKHIAPARIARLTLQKVRKSDLENFFNVDLKAMAPASVSVAHAMLSKALNDAVDDHTLAFNAATRAKNRRKVEQDAPAANAQYSCWTSEEARTVLAAPTSPQMAAFVALALDSGMRKSELCALIWTDLDLESGVVSVWRQLDDASTPPVYGPLKNKKRRKITLMTETIAKLKTHKRGQASLKMKNRTTYQEYGLVFAREPEQCTTPGSVVGQPIKTLSEEPFRRLVAAAGVRRIKFHGLRHTSATLLIQAGVPIVTVSARLGHARASQTLDVYSHVLPEMQGDAADRLGALLAGR